MSKVSTEKWKELVNDFGAFILEDAKVEELEKGLADCYYNLIECKGNKEKLMEITKKEFGNFRIFVPLPTFNEQDQQVYILFKVNENDVVHIDNTWGVVHGSETQFIADWLKRHSGNQLKTIFMNDPRAEVKNDAVAKKGNWWPDLKPQTGESENIVMYFQLNFADY